MTVRENLANELMEDLGCIRNQNNEAIHVATVWLKDGYDIAQKSRREAHSPSGQESTPLRDRNFNIVNLLVCNSLYVLNYMYIYIYIYLLNLYQLHNYTYLPAYTSYTRHTYLYLYQ